LGLFGSLAVLGGCSADTTLIFGDGGGGSGSTTDGSGGDATSSGGGVTTTTNVGGGVLTVPTQCGDGVLDVNEDCDGANLGGKDCTDLGYQSPEGLACTAGCLLDPAACQAECGNGLAEPGEMCDGVDTAGSDCTDYGFGSPGTLGCLPDCSDLDATKCMASCNGVLEPGEDCDGTNLGGSDCTDFGYVNAAGLACSACAFSTTGCSAVCGNGAIEPGEDCDDGNAMPGDGCSATCTTESATGDTCASAITVSLALGTVTVTGDTVGGGSHAGTNCTGAATDRVYAVTPSADGYLTARLPRSLASYDSVLYISTACSETANVGTRICADSYDNASPTPLKGGELLSLPVTQGTTYYLYVDGYFVGDTGTYSLELDLSNGRSCNDPVPLVLEPGTPMTVLGNDTLVTPTTAGSCGGNPGDEVYYSVQRTAAGSLGVATIGGETNYNSVLYARTSCTSTMAASELACSNGDGNAGENISLNLQANTPVSVIVDGSQAGGGNAFGSYGLRLTP